MRPTTSSSNIHRRALCPGSHAAEEGLPERTSADAEEGTLLHLHAADPALPRDDLDEDQRHVLDVAARIESDVLDLIIAAENLHGSPFTDGSEKKIALRRGIRPVLTGHCDYWRFYPERGVLIILDRKFGRGVVTAASGNYQLRAYAVQGADEWGAEKVFAAIVQPRLGHHAPPIVRYERADIDTARREIFDILDATLAPDAPRHPSEAACQYCKAATTCEARRAMILSAEPLSQLPAASLTDDELGLCLRAIDMMTDAWVDDIKAEARRRLRDGRLATHQLVENAPRREISDPALALRLLRDAGFPQGQLDAAVKLSVGSVQRLYIAMGRKKKEATECVNHVLAPAISAKEIEPSIRRR